jgi:hypothetical protein
MPTNRGRVTGEAIMRLLLISALIGLAPCAAHAGPPNTAQASITKSYIALAGEKDKMLTPAQNHKARALLLEIRGLCQQP